MKTPESIKFTGKSEYIGKFKNNLVLQWWYVNHTELQHIEWDKWVKITIGTILCWWIHNIKSYKLGHQYILWGQGNEYNSLLQLKFSCYQLKIDGYNYKIYYETFMVTTRQRPIINTQRKKRKKSKHTTKRHEQLPKKGNKRGTMEQRKCKTIRKYFTKWWY